VGLAPAAVMSRSDGLVGEGEVGTLLGAISCVIGNGSGSVLADRESRPPHCDMKDKTVKENRNQHVFKVHGITMQSHETRQRWKVASAGRTRRLNVPRSRRDMLSFGSPTAVGQMFFFGEFSINPGSGPAYVRVRCANYFQDAMESE
jgi:hypothetical protein